MYLYYNIVRMLYGETGERCDMCIIITAPSNPALPYLHQPFHHHPLDQGPPPPSRLLGRTQPRAPFSAAATAVCGLSSLIPAAHCILPLPYALHLLRDDPGTYKKRW